ncbi:hypothetical protein C2G38_2166175 [Gigaspora rosea]|uniref:Uncharacterized protein n=1 Tax=Gigaspora rosea TaxID=44941 RepID=A0A397W1Y4_9GLOM|nr:hypothetical protein C2G38_2166175 [Gigaspora rosea]
MVDPKSRSSSSKLDQAKPYVRPSSSSKAASVQSSSSKSINKALDEFHRIYDFRLTTSCDFLIWRTYNQVYLPVTNLKEELNNYFATRRQYEEWSEEDKEINKELEKKCESAKFFTLSVENPKDFYEWCEKDYKVTLAAKILSNNLVVRNAIKKELFEKYRDLQGHFTQWKYLYENEYIDIGNTFAKTITWDLIKALEYDDPLLSFIIDFTKSQDELKSKVPPVKKLVARQLCNLNNEDKSQPFYLFMRDICKICFAYGKVGSIKNVALKQHGAK